MPDNFNNQFNYNNQGNQQQPYYQPMPYGMPQYQPTPYEAAMMKMRMEKKAQRKSIMRTSFVLGCTIIAYIIGQVLVSLLLDVFNLKELYTSSSVFQNCFTAVGISLLSMSLPFFIMSRILKRNYVSPLVPTKKNPVSTNLAWIGFGLGACFVAQIVAAVVIQLFKQSGYELTQPESNDPETLGACLIMLLAISIVPAIFEEFSLRCCAMGALRKYGKGFAVFLSSVVFGLMHMNVIQFVFAFLVGMVLGYITIKTDNIMISMIVHGTNNSASVIKASVEVLASRSIANTVSSAIMILWIAVGIIGFIALLYKKQFKNQDKTINPFDNNFMVKALCAIPGLIVPFILMIIITSQSVVPIK